MENNKKQFVILHGCVTSGKDENWWCSFFTTNVAGSDPTKSYKGETWYKIIGYADTVEEAQQILYGV